MRTIGTVRAMTENALSLHRKIPVTFTKSGLIILMAGKAKTVFVKFKEGFHI